MSSRTGSFAWFNLPLEGAGNAGRQGLSIDQHVSFNDRVLPEGLATLFWGMTFNSRTLVQVAFWFGAAHFYIWYVGRGADAYLDALPLAVPLLLVAMATSWVVGWILVPRYLLTGRRVRFGLYTLYALIVSAYLVLGIIVGDFVLSGYRVSDRSPVSLDRPALFLGVYVVVATAVILRMVSHWDDMLAAHQRDRAQAEARLSEASRVAALGRLEILVDRETVRLDIASISHLESAGDYVIVHTDKKPLMTKARLGDLADRLVPAGFVRVHRSFVVRIDAIRSRTAAALSVGHVSIPIGRSYRVGVRAAVEAAGSLGPTGGLDPSGTALENAHPHPGA